MTDRGRPVLVALSGLPGVGKTTLGRALARATGAVFLRIDTVEEALSRSMLGIADPADAGYAAAIGIARDNLALGRDVIADSVNAHDATRAWYAQAAAEARAELVNVEAICSDPVEHRRRILSRPHPTPSGVAARAFEPWRIARVQLDMAALTVEEAVERLCTAMSEARAA